MPPNLSGTSIRSAVVFRAGSTCPTPPTPPHRPQLLRAFFHRQYTPRGVGIKPKPRARRTSRGEGWTGEVRLPVVLLRSVAREGVGEEIFRHRWRPPWEFQRVETPPYVIEDLEDDWWLGTKPDDTHSLAATAKERIDLVDSTDSGRKGKDLYLAEAERDKFRIDFLNRLAYRFQWRERGEAQKALTLLNTMEGEYKTGASIGLGAEWGYFVMSMHGASVDRSEENLIARRQMDPICRPSTQRLP